MRHRVPIVVLVAALAPAGCAGDLRDGQDQVADLGGSARVRLRQEGGALVAQVDAREEGRWVYLALDRGTEVEPGDPRASQGWDLGLNRYRIQLNGGVSGPGQGAAASLPGTPFDQVDRAPADGYLEDAPEVEAGKGPVLALLAGDGWYRYDMSTHTLTPRDVTYVVRSARGAYFKLRIDGYYDQAGTSGYPTLRFAPVAAP